MPMNDFDYNLANSKAIEENLCTELAEYRIKKGIKQTELAKKAGIGIATLKRLEKGQGVSSNSLIRVLQALNLVENLKFLIPTTKIDPIERWSEKESTPKRVRDKKVNQNNWQWGDDE